MSYQALLVDLVLNFSFMELLWTATAVFALYVAWMNIHEAKTDLEALDRLQIQNGRRILAKGNVRRERIRSVVNGTYLALGLFAGIFVPANPTPTLLGVIATSGLIATSMLLAYSSLADRRDRWAYNAAALAHETARDGVRDDARDAERDAERDPERDAGRDTGRDAVRDPARDAAHDDEQALAGPEAQLVEGTDQ